MAKCQRCGSNDADVDWGLCYDCLSRVTAMNYRSMGMHESANRCNNYADKLSFINKLKADILKNDSIYFKIKQFINYDYDYALQPIYEALGWQGGTIHQIVEEIKKLKENQ